MSRESWAPRWAPHASGTYDRAIDEDGKPEPTWIELRCSECGAEHRVRCDSGAPIHKIQAWASAHLHRDPMDHRKFVEAVNTKKGGGG